MSNRLFQGIIHQMHDTVDRVIGVIDDTGLIIACSELSKIGEVRAHAKDEMAYTTDTAVIDGYTYQHIGSGAKPEFMVFVEGEDKVAEKYASILAILKHQIMFLVIFIGRWLGNLNTFYSKDNVFCCKLAFCPLAPRFRLRTLRAFKVFSRYSKVSAAG